jgi:membrane peptidoglycan carboxypeptidase
VVWVGFDDNKDLRLKASDAALPLWADFMKQALDLRPELGGNSFARPGGIVNVDIDPATGLVASEECLERRQEIFISGTEPIATCSHLTLEDTALVADGDQSDSQSLDEEPANYSSVTLEICSETGLLASSSCTRVTRRSFEIGEEPLDTCRAESHGGTTRVRPPIVDPINAPGDKMPDVRERVKSSEGHEMKSAQPTRRSKKGDTRY